MIVTVYVYTSASDQRVLLDIKEFETALAAGLFSADRMSAGYTTRIESTDEWTDQCHTADRAKERSE
jgi:hypothetical protein